MGVFTSNLEWEVPYAEAVSTAKMVNFRPAIIELWMCENGIFLVPVKHILVCHASTSCTWLHDTLSCVLIYMCVCVCVCNMGTCDLPEIYACA